MAVLSTPPPSLLLWFSFLRSALNKLFSAIIANTIQSVAPSLFNLISSLLISPIHPLAAVWFTIVTPFPATKNPIFIKFVILRRIRDFIYVGVSPGRPPHASWAVNWLRKQAGGYIHMRNTPTSLLHVLWAVTNVCYLTQRWTTSEALNPWRSCSALLVIRGPFILILTSKTSLSSSFSSIWW